MKDLAGRVAVVTGAASGIGFGLAERFAAEGMAVVMADVEHAALDAAAERLTSRARTDRAAGVSIEAVPTDVTDPDAVDALATRAVERFGAVHVVCNNAGVVTLGSTWEQSLADWRWVIDVDLWGVINGIRAFVPLLLRDGEPGHVVNTASIAGLVPSPTIAPYNAAKAGVIAVSETLEMELRQLGAPIGVSVLCPGVVPTRIAESGRNRKGAATDADARLDIPTQDELPTTALTPEQIAERVLHAIVHDEFWIVTHAGSDELIGRRASAIIGGGRPEVPPVF